jgi:hypothetical protein
VLIKKSSDNENWYIYDSMRGVITGPHENGLDRKLLANSSSGEGGLNYYDPINFGASGFNIGTTDNELNGSGGTYIYIAIRRGPMRAPESGTEVFAVDNGDGSSVPGWTSGFPVDMAIETNVSVTDDKRLATRLLSGTFLQTNQTLAENPNSARVFDYMNGWLSISRTSVNYSWMFRRAPGFFDVVAYIGDGTTTTIPHNLQVVPELIINKVRNDSGTWRVHHADFGYDYEIYLNGTTAINTRLKLSSQSGQIHRQRSLSASNGSAHLMFPTYSPHSPAFPK